MHRTHVRRRVTIVLVILGLAVTMTGPVAGTLGSDPSGMSPVGHRAYLVRQGDTLWEIASRSAPGRDPREVIEAIEAENGVDADSLVPGLVLSIPSVD